MTTNEERAADVLAEAGAYCGECCFGECGMPDCPRDADWRGCPDCAAAVNGYARALAAAGLLAPDLPEANDDSHIHPSEGWALDVQGRPVVWSAPGGRVMIQRIEPGDLTPAQARDFALNILAAADYCEGDHDD